MGGPSGAVGKIKVAFDNHITRSMQSMIWGEHSEKSKMCIVLLYEQVHK